MGRSHRLSPAGSAILVAVAVLSAACGSAPREASPGPASASSAPAVLSPTEKAVIKMPRQSFNPNGNAADGILALESQGYSVVVQNGGGDPGKRNPLSQCRIAGVDGLRGDSPPANTTVYLTVAC